ncbi:hypothetical protein ACFQU1_01645 [Chelatococcus sp. GCM10030263]|uniref:hypothetical protein n=1 Tax=Chelatococcus sp. GCM10030263 TaxID=3273387 RepID=UPI003616DECA
MPFYKPFKGRFEHDDLIYGLEPTRARYRRSYPSFAQAGEAGGIHCIDQYKVVIGEEPGPAPPRLEDFLGAVRGHPKYSTLLTTSEENWTEERYNRDIRRKIKAGLDWMCNDPCDTCVHFLLDDIDMRQVARKEHDADCVTKFGKQRSFTGVELRWIYRNRYKPEVQRRIQFWMRGEPTCPPWVPQYPHHRHAARLWRSYVPRSEGSEGSRASQIARFLQNLF